MSVKLRKNVSLYTKKRCQQCKLTKLWLDEHSVHYHLVDIVENKFAAEKTKQLGYQTVAVVVIHAEPETSWSGFRPDVLEGEFL